MKETIKNKIVKNKIVLISIFIAMLLISFGVIYASNFASKGELNDDGEINYADVELLELHLIHLRELPEDKLSNADMNSDGEITVTDLTLLIKKIEKTLDYKVTIENLVASNYYPNKNEEIVLNFDAIVNYDGVIDTIIVNEKEYQIARNEADQNLYQITLNVGDASGVKEIKFEKAKLTNGKEIELDNTIKVDVLKEMPDISGWTLSEDIQKSEINIFFDVLDPDGAFTSGSYRITEKIDETNQNEDINETENEIGTGSITTDINSINIKVEEDKEYEIIICIEYNLDTDTLEQEGEYAGVILKEEKVSLIVDYNFDLSNLETYKYIDNGKEKTKEFGIGESIVLQFHSTNSTECVPKRAVVNGKEYEVSGENNTYVVVVDGLDSIGEHTVNIEKVILSNGKNFEVNETVAVEIIKNAPTAIRFNASENVEEKYIEMDLYLKDTDKTITSLVAKVFDEQNNEISSQDLSMSDDNITNETDEELKGTYHISANLDTSKVEMQDTYKIKIFASYNLLDDNESYTHTNEIILEEELEAKPVVNIKSVEVSNKYPEKGENVTLTYKIETNKKETEITHIMVNNVRCIATKNIDDEQNVTYSVTLNVGENAGILNLNTTEFKFEKDLFCNVNDTVQVDILKDKPTSEAFSQVDDIENRAVTLTAHIIDPDGALISGIAELVRDSDNEVVATKTFDAEHITFRIEGLELDTEYTLVAKMTYDRDTNTIEEETNKNYVIDEIFRRRPIQLVADYEMEINNIKTYNGENETSYFERGEEVTLSFNCTNKTQFYPVYAIINGKQYELEKQEENYKTKIQVVSEYGAKTITIEKLILNNTIEVEITENNQISVGILKLRPTITDFVYTEDESGTNINVEFTVNDEEETITGGKIIVQDENGRQIKEESFSRESNGITFPKGNSEGYVIKVLADYDLDTNKVTQGDNEYTEQELLSEEISVNRLIEFKDITDVQLYKQNGNNVESISDVEIAELQDLSQYVVKVNMENARSFYAPIKEYKIQDNKLRFVLEYNEIIQYEENEKRNQLEVEYGDVENGVAKNVDLDKLIQLINDNPEGNYILTSDIDATKFNTGTSIITTEFSGTIDFKGHKITNLSRPLFGTLNGATIKNLVIENATMTANGVLATSMSNSIVQNIHITNATLTVPNTNGTGIFAGIVSDSSLIEECSATNITIGTQRGMGGFVGKLDGSTIRNCYLQGKASSPSYGVGGFVAQTLNSATIENIYVNEELAFTGGNTTRGGIVGIPGNQITLKNSLSLVTNTESWGHRVFGNSGSLLADSENNYELDTSNMASNASHKAVSTVTLETLKTVEFYKDSLGWSEDIWDFTNVSKGEYPTLKNADPNYEGNKKEEETPSNTEIYIPDYKRIKELTSYQNDREIIYYNMYRIMPFYDAKYYVKDGNLFEEDHILNTKIIRSILPYDENGKLVVGLAEEQKDKIKTIKILFTDDETVSYQVEYKKTQESIVHYKIDELGIDYTFDKYLINTQSNSYQYIVNQIKAFNYAEDLEALVEGNEVRTTSENYEVVKEQAEEFAIKLLANNSEYTITTANSVVDNKIKNDLTTDKMLEKLAYVYNYYNRYYNIEIGGVNMSDIIFFDFSIFSNNLNSVNVTNTYINTTAAYRGANNIVTYYNTYIMPNTGLKYMDFLEFFIKNIADAKYKEDPASWIIDNFKGPIYEEVAPRYPDIPYRVWDHLKATPSPNTVPLLLSYQGDEIYLLGIPTTLLTGNIELYTRGSDNKTNGTNYLKNFAYYAVPFYDTIAGVVEGTAGYTNMTNRTQVSYDTTNVRNWSQDENIPAALKAFNEPLGLWITSPASSAAFANGTDMRWVNSYALTSFVIYSHESVHNQDGRIFLEGTGRRSGAGAEHFTDNFLTQGNNAYGVVPNYSLTRTITTQTTTNISKDRVDTRDKVESYYKGMYDTFAYLDYIEAQAFLQLTPAEQSKIALVVDDTGAWSYKTEEDFKNMNLRTIEDLWDNHLIIIRGGKAYTTGSWWYVYENKNVGAAGKAQFVLNAYQFLADFGYDGYVAYAGNKYGTKTDEEILRILTNDDEMTFKKYQLSRYENVEQNLDKVQAIDVEEAIRITLEAMKLDVEYNRPIDINSYGSIYRETLYGYLKRITNDFETSIYDTAPNVVHITTAEELIEKVQNNPEVNIVLDADIDFSGYEVGIDIDYYISTFVGTFDGNGHTITGLERPLFSNILFAKIKNLNIADSEITSLIATAGTLARAMDFSLLENININNVSITGISTVGGLVGNINRTTVTNITYNGINVSTTNNAYNEVGGLFGKATYSYIENVHGVDCNISGSSYVGGIAGNVNMMHKIKESSFNGTITAGGNYIGGLIGYLQNSTIENCYSLGKVTGRSFTGGLVGTVSASILDKTYSNATVTGSIAAGTGGLIGNVLSPTNGRTASLVKDSIALGKVNNGYKFDAYSTKAIIEACFTNNYELEDAMGISTIDRSDIEFNNRITKVSLSNLNNEFYTNTLSWDSNIWNLKNVQAGGLPKLKGLDTNDVDTIIVKTEISTIDEFLKINEAPSEIYVLTNNIDFTGYTATNTAIITSTFTGKIEGNGHTISNINNATLFEQFNGTVEDLNISNVNIQRQSEDNIAAFARKTSGAKFTNMKFENITIQGRSSLGVVVGTDNKGSIFDRISIKGMNITASVNSATMFAGGIVGAQYGGRITNVYVEGTISTPSFGAGGIIGAIGNNGNNVTISNAISKVDIIKTASSTRTFNAGIVGYIADTSKLEAINNSIALGNMTGYNGTMVPNKFISTTEDIIIAKLTKCYECLDVTGESDVTENTTGHLNIIAIQNLNAQFYRELGFDESIWNLNTVTETGYPELK